MFKVIILLLSFSTVCIQGVNAQLSKYLAEMKLLELKQLDEGLVLIPMLDEFDGLHNEIDSICDFSKIHFYDPSGETNSISGLPLIVHDSKGNKDSLKNLSGEVFLMKAYFEEFDFPFEHQYQSSKKPKRLLIDYTKNMPKSSYKKELAMFSPNSTRDGGLLLVKYEPMIRNLSKRKVLLADFYVFAQFHSEIPVGIRYLKSFERINELIDERKRLN